MRPPIQETFPREWTDGIPCGNDTAVKNVFFLTLLALITATFRVSAATEWENGEVTPAPTSNEKSVSGTFKSPTSTASAAIEWENSEVILVAKPTDKSVSATFKFKNAGSSPVTIKRVRPTCGCTTTELTKTTYEPGESGSIVAHFDIGSRVGEQAKEIIVTSDDQPNTPKVLVFKVNIDDPITITGASMKWKSAGEPTPQQFKIQVHDGYTIHVADVRTSNQHFTAKLTTIKEGSNYVIDVAPTTLDGKAFGLLVVTTDYPAADPRVLYAQLRVQ